MFRYSSTRKWGSVSITIKRLFIENFKGKESKAKERDIDRQQQCEEAKGASFDVVVKAKSVPKSSRKSSSTHVKSSEIPDFYRQMKDIIQGSTLFRGAQGRRLNKQAQKEAETDEDNANADANMQPTKNRAARRKEMKKQRKKEFRAIKKREQMLQSQQE